MRNTVRVLSVFICAVLLFVSVFVPNTFADSARQGKITGDAVRLRDKATTATGSNTLAYLSLGTIVQINGTVQGNEAVSGAGKTWYNVTVNGKTGYVYGKYVEEITQPATVEPDFEKNLLNFPESYRAALRAIHTSYPNWVFVADNVNMTLDAAINLEYSGASVLATKKWVELSYGAEWRDSRIDILDSTDYLREGGRWTFASREAIAYFMDPRNALTVTNSKASFPNIFTFLQQSYDSATQTEAGLKTVIKGTFLEKGYNGNANAYVSDIMAAAKESGVSPYVIASTIRIEQGVNGTSSLISGTYKGYEGYYNFFNYGATGSNVVVNGLKYAKNKGWNSRKASIVGGAKLYAEGYIKKGQDTYYYMDFNIKSNATHQYATCVYDQCNKAVSMRSVCTSNSSGALTFKIPVYTSMPATAYKAPTVHTCVAVVKNAKAATCLTDGYSGDTYCKVCAKLVSSGSVVKATGHKPNAPVNVKAATCLNDGYSGDIYCKTCGALISSGSIVKAGGHSFGDWIIDTPASLTAKGKCHRACTACGATEIREIAALGEKTPGDVNGDGALNNKDLSRLFQFLSDWDVEVSFSALDINNDTFINNKDLTRLFQYLSDWEVQIY